jgi:hypothetical protein
MHGDIEVISVSAEEAEHGVAELWADGEQFGWTHLEEGVLVLRLEPRKDGSAHEFDARSLAKALAEADRLISER